MRCRFQDMICSYANTMSLLTYGANRKVVLKLVNVNTRCLVSSTQKFYSTGSEDTRSQSVADGKKSYKIVVVGSGTGGCSVAHRFARVYGKAVAVIEPKDKHYYQPMFTLVGSGLKSLSQTVSDMKDVLPSGAEWLKHSVAEFNPDENLILMDNGEWVKYDYLVVAMGLQLMFEKVKGLPAALHSPGVCSNYTPETVGRTLENINSLKSGRALFTFPSTPIKCPGAPQKIVYLADAQWRKSGVRSNIEVVYNTALPVIFGVPKYAKALQGVCDGRDIQVNFRHNLIEVRPDSKEAIFAKLDEQNKPLEEIAQKYDMLHVAPPCGSPPTLSSSKLADSALGFLDVSAETLQHTRYSNVFGIGDCTNVPTSKTAAACAAQAYVLEQNLKSVIAGKELKQKYNGYTSCPLTTGNSKCIMAEFGFNGEILETFPVDQGKERRSMFYMKKDFMPQLYWHGLIRGKWNGPSIFRRLFHPFS